MPIKKCELATCEEALTGRQTRFCCPQHRALWHKRQGPAEDDWEATLADRERRLRSARQRREERDQAAIRRLPCLSCGQAFQRPSLGRHAYCCSARCRKVLYRVRKGATGAEAVGTFMHLLDGSEGPADAFRLYTLWAKAAKVPYLDRAAWLFDALYTHGVFLTHD